MKKFRDRKVLVHCQANLRASSMTFPYRVIVDHEIPETAHEPVTQVWSPEGSWTVDHYASKKGRNHF